MSESEKTRNGAAGRDATRQRARVSGVAGAVATAITDALRAAGWEIVPPKASDADWLVHGAIGATPEGIAALLADLRAWGSARPAHAADRAGSPPPPDARPHSGIVLILDLTHAQPRAGERSPPFARALAQRILAAALPMLALEFAPGLRVNAIGILPEVRGGTTPAADIAAALRFIIDAPALTGQMIALDGGRTVLVPAPGLGTPDRP